MNVHSTVSAFLGRHGFSVAGYELNTIIDSLLYDMSKGLEKGQGLLNSMDASEPMFATWSLPPEEAPKNQSVIVIDAGGTNFRSCLVNFDEKGIATISELEKTSMPGIKKELSKKEFFDAFANNLEHLKNKASKIGFCFSYEMEITPDKDGRVMKIAKEVKAPEVEGSLLGECLSKALEEHGWNKLEKITLINDTTAALLAGASQANEGRAYSSYIGFILGTGTNSAYIESSSIKKIENLKDSKGNPPPKSQIIVCESGAFNKLPLSDFDIEYDKTSVNPGQHILEKMSSGAYLGPIGKIVLQSAAKDGLFSDAVAKDILALEKLELKDMDQFFYATKCQDTVLGEILSKGSQEDADTAFELLDKIVERSARLAAAIIAASVIKSGKGKSASLPVAIVCNGTTFYKTHNLKNRVLGFLNDVLISQRNLYFEVLSIENDITLGTAIAAV